MYGSHQHSKALSPVILAPLTFLMAILMNVPVMMSADATFAEKIISLTYTLLMTAAATFAANNIGIYKNNNFITPFYMFLIGGVLGYNTGYWQGFVISALLLTAWYSSIIVNKHKGYEWNAIDASICICLASLFNGYILILLPVMIVGFAIYGRLNARTLLATLLGGSMIYGASWGGAFILGKDCEFLSYMKSVMTWEGFSQLRIMDIIICSLIAFYVILSYILFMANRYSNNPTYIRKAMQFSYLTLLTSVSIALLFGRAETLVPFICVMTSILLTRRTDSMQNKAGVTLLYIITTLLILLFIAKNFLF